jgi:hypothetical protein
MEAREYEAWARMCSAAMMRIGRLWFLIGTVIAVAVGVVHPPLFGDVEMVALLGGVVWFIGSRRLESRRKH